MKASIISALGILYVSSSFAALECKPYPFLKDGFNMQAYQHCKSQFKTCHSKAGVPNLKCVDEKIKQTPACQQLSALSSALDASPATISANSIDGGYTIINQNFIADGQNNYYIVSPQACMLNTIVDPRTLHPQLQTQFENFNFVITNTSMPIAVTPNATAKEFIVTLKVAKGCLACETLGYAIIKYTFDRDGHFKSSFLKSFTEEKELQKNDD